MGSSKLHTPQGQPASDTFVEALIAHFTDKLADPADILPSTRCIARPELISMLGSIRDELAHPGYRAISADALLGVLERSRLVKPIAITSVSKRVGKDRFYAIGSDVDPNLIDPAELLQAHAPDGVICYFTALQIHGMTTQPATHHHIARARSVGSGNSPQPTPTDAVLKSNSVPPLGSEQFKYQDVSYFLTMRDFSILRKTQRQYLNGRSKVRVTTVEQTLVDTMHRPMSAGGPAVVFEAWETAAAQTDAAQLLNITDIALLVDDPLLARRVGYMLDLTYHEVAPLPQIASLHALANKNISSDTGEPFSLIAGMPYKTYDSRWQLLVP